MARNLTLDSVLRDLQGKREGIENAILDGAYTTFEDYRLAVGERRGLLFSETQLKDLARSQESDDE